MMSETYSNDFGYFSCDEQGNVTEYYPTKKALHAALKDGSAWGFALERAPAQTVPRTQFLSTKTRPRVLFTGLDLLPGQNDLFDVE